jgi:hypothetical protein
LKNIQMHLFTIRFNYQNLIQMAITKLSLAAPNNIFLFFFTTEFRQNV